MPTLLHWAVFWAAGGPSAPAVPLVNYDDWLQPRIDTTGTFSTDSDPDQGADPLPLSTDIGPTFDS
jgi:hypothetical protein